MAKLRFRLQSVLTHRKRVEERFQMELAGIRSEYLREEQARSTLQRSLEGQMEELARLQGAGILDVASIELGLAALGRTEGCIEQQQVLLERLSNRAEEKREELIRAMKGRQALERLKERQRIRALAEERRADAKASDEVSRAQYHRAHYAGSAMASAG